jgi:hypothetical protein
MVTRVVRSRGLIACWLLAGCVAAREGDGAPLATASHRPTLAEKAAPFRAMPGFLPLYWDEALGKLWLEIARFDMDLLYVDSLPSGLGSNDIGLDRGQLGRARVVRFTRSGPKVLLVEQNLGYRAELGSAAEREAVRDSFAQSVLAGFDVAAEEDGRVLVDATDFFLSDAHGVADTLRSTGQGSFTLDKTRCAFHLPNTRNFPRNTEVEVTLTFTGREPGPWVLDVAPDPTALTVRTRHSLIELPGPGYVPRPFDPRAGYFPMAFADYSTPIGEPLVRRFLTRHRLEKKDPRAARSAVVEPIVYYLDPATPEPIRSALLEGARWWSRAFEAAGFLDAFRVELLPADADPLDVRYNVIQWVHRATRGWSYGGGVTDPRTGEIIKGHVSLGSLRVRQDYLIAEGLLAPYESATPVSPEMERMALARLRQLAAHEVGHTLGLAHNYLASTAGRASVMDYPHPLAVLRPDGEIDLSAAYAEGVGAWDEVAIAYGYAQFAPGTDGAAALEAILSAARERGLTFLTDQDARPLGSSHPLAHLWDNGPNAVDELERLLALRAAALARFGENAIRPGRPLATLEEALVPLYLSHRYALEAAAKSIAGVDYTYALRGDGQRPLAPVPADEQRRALTAVLATLEPDRLTLPETLLALLPPRPAGFERHRELFENTAGTFDALAPARAAAALTAAALLQPDRAARLVEQHARDAALPGLEELLERVLAATWKRPSAADLAGEVQRSVDAVVLGALFRLASLPEASAQVQAVTEAKLVELSAWIRQSAAPAEEAERVHLAHADRLVQRFLERPEEFVLPPLPRPPPGQPIGSTEGCDF